MKRFFLSLLCVCLLCGALSVAAATPTVTTLPASDATLKVGDEITFTVRMEGVTSVKAMAIRIGYGFDAAVFSFVTGEWLVESTTMVDVDEEKLNAVIHKPKSCTGDVFRFTLRVREDAPSGATQVKAGAVLGMEGGNQTANEVGCTLTVVGAPTTTTTSKPSATTTTTSRGTSGTGTTTASVTTSDKQTGTTTTGDRTQDTGLPTGSTVDSPAITTEEHGSATVTDTDTDTEPTGTTAVVGSTTQPSGKPTTEDSGEDSTTGSIWLWGGLGAGAVILAVILVVYIYNRKK